MKRGKQAGSSGFGGFGGHGSQSSLSYLAEPPSFNSISDPNIVVSLKNVLKKDSTTKTKALEDVLAYVQAHPFEQNGGVEEGILDVWEHLYPRASIDNARRVRELSHILQFELMKSARKRMERRIPNLVGAWLAGLFDRDRVVARAANDGLSSFLTTPEKTNGFWKKCQSQILTFASEAIQETADTLSDDRSTTKEDADAKYFRVINASLSLVLNLLHRIDDNELGKAEADYEHFVSSPAIWKSITLMDAAVRRTTSQLLLLCLKKQLSYADTADCRNAFITGGLKTPQTGSAVEYLTALVALTSSKPDIWNPAAKSKKSPLERLEAFIAKGSQGSRSGYWEALTKLLSVIPNDAYAASTSTNTPDAIRQGLQNREEPRTNNTPAWKCYTDSVSRELSRLDTDQAATFAASQIFPLFEHYIFPVAGKNTSGAGGISVTGLKDLYVSYSSHSTAASASSKQEWERLGEMMCAKLSASLPGVSREYQSSQELVGEEGKRWLQLDSEIHKAISVESQEIQDFLSPQSSKIVAHSMVLLESRNMKPFGAARILASALQLTPYIFQDELGTRICDFLEEAANEHIDRVVESPSASTLQACVNAIGTIDPIKSRFDTIWDLWVKASLSLPPSNDRAKMLGLLVAHDTVSERVRKSTTLQAEIISQGRALATGQSDSWGLFTPAISHNGLDKSSATTLTAEVTQLIEEKPSERALEVLELIIRSMPELLSENEDLHTSLVTQLLALADLNERSPLSAKAAMIRSMMENHNDGQLPLVGIIHGNLDHANPQSLTIDTLIKQAKSATENGTPLEELFPSTNVWMQEIAAFTSLPINPSLTITNSLQGAATLGQAQDSHSLGSIPRVERDRKGRSIPVRMALYSTALCSGDVEIFQLPTEFLVELLYLKCITIQLATDQLTALDNHGLWADMQSPATCDEAEGLVTTLRSQIRQYAVASEWWQNTNNKPDSVVMRKLVQLLITESSSLAPQSVYSSRALSEILQAVSECPGAPALIEENFIQPVMLKVTPESTLVAAAFLTGLGESLQSSKQINNFCNRLISDVAGATVDGKKTSMILVLCSLLSHVYEAGELPVANNRIVFAVRQITSWMEEPEEIDGQLSADICRALLTLLPCMKDVYGSYWEKTVDFCLFLWNGVQEHYPAEALPLIHSSLKLSKMLESMTEANDDALDAVKTLQTAKPKALMELLKLPRAIDSQPAEIVDAMLCREVEKIPDRSITELDEIFPLVASESKEIQTAAFNLLHRAIPLQQQQLSVDALLDKTDARLPDELLSLLLDAPNFEELSDEALSRFPASVRCYLLSWKLVFDAFSTSSFKLRNDFMENLKADGCINPLLDFLFDVLGHSAAHPLNLDKEGLGSKQIYDYDVKLARAESDEKDMQWLLVHLYYLVLKYTSGLFRTWYIDCRSKQTRIAVESWTTKYYSPLIITDTLEEIQTWADSQEPPAMDEQELQIKVSSAAREVTAGYEVDEAQASIVIKIPSSYPIENVVVNSLHRVAVSEKKWQSWIMTTQGVITFSNGNIIDGLQVFKRNIVGALKGQSECAICYSIISTDKRMPDKRCSTCKNLFHRTCLYKWFQTSSQNTCPLCRNPIDYLGADTAKRRQ